MPCPLGVVFPSWQVVLELWSCLGSPGRLLRLPTTCIVVPGICGTVWDIECWGVNLSQTHCPSSHTFDWEQVVCCHVLSLSCSVNAVTGFGSLMVLFLMVLSTYTSGHGGMTYLGTSFQCPRGCRVGAQLPTPTLQLHHTTCLH